MQAQQQQQLLQWKQCQGKSVNLTSSSGDRFNGNEDTSKNMRNEKKFFEWKFNRRKKREWLMWIMATKSERFIDYIMCDTCCGGDREREIFSSEMARLISTLLAFFFVLLLLINRLIWLNCLFDSEIRKSMKMSSFFNNCMEKIPCDEMICVHINYVERM